MITIKFRMMIISSRRHKGIGLGITSIVLTIFYFQIEFGVHGYFFSLYTIFCLNCFLIIFLSNHQISLTKC